MSGPLNLHRVLQLSLVGLLSIFLNACFVKVDVEGGMGKVTSNTFQSNSLIWCNDIGGTCDHNYLKDPEYWSGALLQTITLTAKPEPNFAFVQWRGACHGSTNPVCEKSTSVPRIATAEFRYIGGDMPIENLDFRAPYIGGCIKQYSANQGWTTTYEVTNVICYRTEGNTFQGMQALPKLTSLRINGYCFPGTAICYNPAIKNWDALQYTKIEDLRLNRANPDVKNSGNTLSNTELDIPEIKTLKTVQLLHYGLAGEMPGFRSLPNLETLNVSYNAITSINYFIRYLPDNFKSLTINSAPILCSQFERLFAKQPGVLVNGYSSVAEGLACTPDPV